MTRKIYRTAQGKMVDLGALQLKNENVRAVGNMGVNARGDIVDSSNKTVNTRNQQVAKQYRKQTNVVNEPVTKKSAPAVNVPPPPEDFEDDFVKEPTPEPQASGGLAAAIARARQVKQQPLQTSQEIAQHQSGVKKI